MQPNIRYQNVIGSNSNDFSSSRFTNSNQLEFSGTPETVPTKIELNVHPWQNAVFYFELIQCVDNFFLLDGRKIYFSDEEKPLCHTIFIKDLRSYLSPGKHELVIPVLKEEGIDLPLEIYVSPVLFGFHIGSTLVCIILFAYSSLLLVKLMRWLKFPPLTVGMVVTALAYFSFWLCTRPNLTYTNDLPGHLAYIKHMASHWTHFGYSGNQSFHSPVYYFLMGRIYAVFEKIPQINPLTAIRAFSLFLYITFILFGLRTLKDHMDTSQRGFHVAAFQIVFWPVSILMATRINNDVALYALWGASYFYLCRWHRLQEPGQLALSIIFLALSIMIKSNAMILAAVIGGVVINDYFSSGLSLRQFFSRPLLASYACLAAGVLVNLSRVLVGWLNASKKNYAANYWGWNGPSDPTWRHLFTMNFSEYFEWPFIRWPAKDMPLWNYFFRTSIFGEFSFSHSGWAKFISILILINATLLAVALLFFAYRRWRESAPLVIGVIFPLVFLVAYMYKKHWAVCQDFRYVLPILIPCAVLYGKGIEYARGSRWGWLYGFGLLMGVLLPISAIGFYLSQ